MNNKKKKVGLFKTKVEIYKPFINNKCSRRSICSLITILLFKSLNAFSQHETLPGYILNAGNDTVWGEIKVNSLVNNASYCVFKTKGANSFKKYYPEDIIEYRMTEGKYYVSKAVTIKDSMEHLFLEYLVNGIVSLYYVKTGVNDYFFIEKEGELIKLSNDELIVESNGQIRYKGNSNQFKGALLFITKENPEFSSKINTTTFNYNSLIKTTVDYHNLVCSDQECLIYSKATNTKIYLAPYAGFAISMMNLKGSPEKPIDIGPSFGLNMTFTPSYFNQAFAIGLGLNYSKYHFQEFFSYHSNTNFGAGYGINFEYYMLTIPIFVTRQLGSGSFIPNIFLGAEPCFLLAMTSEQNFENGYIRELRKRPFNLGFMGGIGFNHKLKSKDYITFNIKYGIRTPVPKTGHLLDNHYIQTLYFNLAYSFLMKK